jgi:ribonuclease Z
MRPRFFPTLVNGRFGDPALYVGFLLERRAMLFDLGDLHALPPRRILRLTDIFVSHAHVDHFIGFDHLLRVILGRDMRLRLYGPAGFSDRVRAKLEAYTWNLAGHFRTDLVFEVTEVLGPDEGRATRFRLKNGFAREDLGRAGISAGVLLDEDSLRVSCAVLDHRTPCLGFALQEKSHVNIWRNRLAEKGLATGPWLSGLKAAILAGLPDGAPIPVQWRDEGGRREKTLPLCELRETVATVTPGHKIGYVTDAAPSAENARAILELVGQADTLFIEAAFAKADSAIATERAHLTTHQAGRLAREAGAARVEPFHFSSRYAGDEARMLQEVETAYLGAAPASSGDTS